MTSASATDPAATGATATPADDRLVPAADEEFGGQYPLGKILTIWAVVAAPMGLIMWWVVPQLVVPRSDFPGLATLVLLTGGLVWQFVVAAALLAREVRPFTWRNLRRRLWLTAPRHPRTGAPSRWLLLWGLAIAVVLLVVDTLAPLGFLDRAFVRAFPAVAAPEHGLIENLVRPQIVGQWWVLGVVVTLVAFNYLLGEELLFRAVLLPKMRGVFGRWDVVANGVLFATYHLHLLWGVPSQLFRDWVYAWAMRRYRSWWVSVVVHGVDALVLLVLFPLAIAGAVTA